MKIGIIDSDLIGQKEHNFPNLACMKISGYHKKKGDNVKLIGYSNIDPFNMFNEKYDKVYISKVFTETKIPEHLLKLSFVEYGGTGFFYDKAENLPNEIEHHFPDYNLYDNWIKEKIRLGKTESYFKYYTDFSIGFTTRGCFRGCEFCVNRNEKKVYLHSPLSEFVVKDRKKICLLDDNILGFGQWKKVLIELQKTEKSFQYKQGMDIRVLTEEKAEMLNNSKYVGNYIFAFDDINDKEMIEKKLQLWLKYHNGERTVLYCFCAFDRNDIYDKKFWIADIVDLLERTKILMKYRARPYTMRYKKWNDSPFKQLYIHISRWTNNGGNFYKQSLREFVDNHTTLQKFEKQYPEIAEKYFDMKFET